MINGTNHERKSQILNIFITFRYMLLAFIITLGDTVLMKFTKQAIKGLKKMPADIRGRFMGAFEMIEAGSGEALDIKKLQGREGYRLRIGGYRAIYTKDMEVIVIDAGPRGGIY